MAIALARLGGIGVLHRNLSIADQVAEVDKVKRSEAGMIVEPVTLSPDALVGDALELMERYRVSGIPITDAEGVLVGILTNRDLRFGVAVDHARRGGDDEGRPRHRAGRDDARGGAGDPRPSPHREAADRRRRRPAQGPDHRQGHLEARGATRSRRRTSAGACGSRAAVGVGTDALERAAALVDAEVDALVVDTAHGHSLGGRRDGSPPQGRATTSRSSPATSPPPRPPRR